MVSILTAVAFAATLDVPGSYPTLGDAVAAASPGDVIELAAGTYCEDVDISVDGLIVRGAGQEDTVLDGSCYVGSVAYAITFGQDIVLQDLTLDGGSVCQGVLVSNNASATLERVTVQNGTDAASAASGGGIRVAAGSRLDLVDSLVQRNTAVDGAGILVAGTAVIRNTRFCANTASDDGGAIHGSAAAVLDVSTSVFLLNSAVAGGGGGVMARGQTTLLNNTFVANDSGGGAAIHAYGNATPDSDDVWVTNNLIAHSTGSDALLEGLLVDLSGSNNLFYGNSPGNGTVLTGAVLSDPLLPSVVDCDTDVALPVGSPAIGAGSDEGVFDDIGAVPFDVDGDGYGVPEDCDDLDDTVHPDVVEVCNGRDDNCDDLIDEGLSATWFLDDDLDSYGDPDLSVEDCLQPLGYVANDLDCDDGDDDVHPEAAEVLDDGIDQDCSGADLVSCFVDEDGDGIGGDVIATDPDGVCGVGLAPSSGDCDDADDGAFPGADEVPDDGVDQDCSGADLITCYADQDGDGFGTTTVLVDTVSCVAEGYAAEDGDCDDALSSVNPAATEATGDGVDQNCDGLENCFVDNDGDGVRTDSVVADADITCTGVGLASALEPSGDCDDDDAQHYPGATEQCDGVDNDCDEIIDEDVIQVDWWPDEDGDGFGDDDATPVYDCLAPDDTWRTSAGDCDDSDALVSPGFPEVPCNGVDDDCDPATEDDVCDTGDSGGDTGMPADGDADADADSDSDADTDSDADSDADADADGDTDADSDADADADSDTDTDSDADTDQTEAPAGEEDDKGLAGASPCGCADVGPTGWGFGPWSRRR